MTRETSGTLNRRRFLQMAGTLVAGATVAGCVQATPQSGATGEGAGAAQAPVELTLLMVDWSDESRTLYEGEVLPAFSQQHPGLTVLPDWTDWDQLDAKVMTAFASGLSPDVFQADNVEFGPKYNQRSIIAELDDLVAATEGGPEKLADFYPKAIDEGSRINGKLVALPYVLDNRGLFYRKDFFAEAGLDETQAFQSWDSFRDAAVALTIRDGDSFTRAGWWSGTTWTCFQTYVQFLWQNGGSLLNETQDAIAFNSDAGLEALAFWARLIQEDKVGPTEDMPNLGDLSPMVAGQLAMQFGGYGQLINAQRYAPEVEEHLNVTILSQQQPAALWYANTFFLSKKEHVNDAWLLLAHLVFDDDNFRKYHEAEGGLPPRQSITAQASHITPKHHILIDDVMAAEGSHTTPAVPFSLEVLQRVSEMCQRAVLGQATPEEAMATAADEATQIIDRYRSEG
jgi:ABC-type glycerol-3-phosphate transport system substrate-binding protein